MDPAQPPHLAEKGPGVQAKQGIEKAPTYNVTLGEFTEEGSEVAQLRPISVLPSIAQVTIQRTGQLRLL